MNYDLNGKTSVDHLDRIDSIKPYFLKHPSKVQNRHIESKINEVGQNHILSLSSDSGLFSMIF